MGESFITRRGGGIPYAIISVTYPSGSTCTCTNGSMILTAKDTSGKALFVIPEAGTWTVKSVKGNNSASKTVSITAEGQVEAVTLSYGLVLFDNGNQNTSVTGGWARTGYSLSGFNSSDTSLTTIGNALIVEAYRPGEEDDEGGVAGTVNQVDVEGMTTLRAQGTVLSYDEDYSNSYVLYVGVNKTKKITQSPLAAIRLTQAGAFDKTLAIPSGQTKLYVFALAACTSGGIDPFSAKLSVSNVSLM